MNGNFEQWFFLNNSIRIRISYVCREARTTALDQCENTSSLNNWNFINIVTVLELLSSVIRYTSFNHRGEPLPNRVLKFNDLLRDSNWLDLAPKLIRNYFLDPTW